jgi:hypothetical protein
VVDVDLHLTARRALLLGATGRILCRRGCRQGEEDAGELARGVIEGRLDKLGTQRGEGSPNLGENVALVPNRIDLGHAIGVKLGVILPHATRIGELPLLGDGLEAEVEGEGALEDVAGVDLAQALVHEGSHLSIDTVLVTGVDVPLGAGQRNLAVVQREPDHRILA